MHLSLQEGREFGRRIELLMTDLPGEWTSDLINRVETASRFRFLTRADAVIYVLDGRLLAAIDSQHQEKHKARLLLERLRKTPLVGVETPLVLLVTKCDEIGMTAPAALGDIVAEATALGFQPNVILSSCFSRAPKQVESGTGVKDVIDFFLGAPTNKVVEISETNEQVLGERAFARFRRVERA
jgi:hypothetical protein